MKNIKTSVRRNSNIIYADIHRRLIYVLWNILELTPDDIKSARIIKPSAIPSKLPIKQETKPARRLIIPELYRIIKYYGISYEYIFDGTGEPVKSRQYFWLKRIQKHYFSLKNFYNTFIHIDKIKFEYYFKGMVDDYEEYIISVLKEIIPEINEEIENKKQKVLDNKEAMQLMEKLVDIMIIELEDCNGNY